MNITREPQVAGMFYSSNSRELENQINEFFNEVDFDIKIKNVFGIVAPHAGYIYSGRVAATAYKTIIGRKFDTVIIISPSHREYFRRVSAFDGDAYKTPLGILEVDKALREKLVNENDLIFESDAGHKAEHALEVQLPFLQIALNDFKILPLVIGEQNRELVYELGDILSKVIDNKTLIVASSDLSHFYTKTKATALDSRVVNHINNFDYESLQIDLERKRCEACGGGGIVAILKALSKKGYTKSKVVAQSDSGDVTGDDSEVVGYLSAVVWKDEKD